MTTHSVVVRAFALALLLPAVPALSFDISAGGTYRLESSGLADRWQARVSITETEVRGSVTFGPLLSSQTLELYGSVDAEGFSVNLTDAYGVKGRLGGRRAGLWISGTSSVGGRAVTWSGEWEPEPGLVRPEAAVAFSVPHDEDSALSLTSQLFLVAPTATRFLHRLAAVEVGLLRFLLPTIAFAQTPPPNILVNNHVQPTVDQFPNITQNGPAVAVARNGPQASQLMVAVFEDSRPPDLPLA